MKGYQSHGLGMIENTSIVFEVCVLHYTRVVLGWCSSYEIKRTRGDLLPNPVNRV